ncbi:MAG: glycerophosphodiester phosphodiesterase family protein [Ilumatobacteraceae bacterium]
MKFQRGRALALAIASTLLIAACGSGSGSAGGTTDPATISSTIETSVATSPAAVASTGPADTASPDTTEPTPEPSAATTVDTDPPASDPVSSGPLTIQQLLDLGRPIVLAHAAGEDQFPHSSPYGYGESVKAGVDMLDFDVQLTGDGVLVIQHDDSTGRTADQDLVVADSTYEQLHALDNAYSFTAGCVCTDAAPEAYIYRGIRTGAVQPPAGYTADDFAIARFSDVAKRFSDYPVNIEIKGEGEPAIAAARELATELAELDLLDNAVVASFDDAVVTAFHEFAPTVEISPGLGASSAWVLDSTPLPDGMRILQLPPKFGEIDVLSPDTMTKTHAAGYFVWVWPNDRTLENPASYQQLLTEGMDGLNINFPGAGVEAVRTFAG